MGDRSHSGILLWRRTPQVRATAGLLLRMAVSKRSAKAAPVVPRSRRCSPLSLTPSPRAEPFSLNRNGRIRAIVFRGASDYSSRAATCGARPLLSELHAALLEQLPKGCVIDGEIVSRRPRGGFRRAAEAAAPAASRVAKLAQATPASFVALTCWPRAAEPMAPPPERAPDAAERLLATLARRSTSPMTRRIARWRRAARAVRGRRLDG